jgi:hypothetical protein
MTIKGVAFGCPECRERVKISHLCLNDNEFVLIGHCDNCDEQLSFSLDNSIANLLDMDIQKGSSRAN